MLSAVSKALMPAANSSGRDRTASTGGPLLWEAGVVFPQRPGGQAQFSIWCQAGTPTRKGLRQVLDSVACALAADHSTAAMAVRASVSERHLARMFRDEVGMTPARYVENSRLEAAKMLLVSGDEGQDAVARQAGFGSAETMRRIFYRALGVSPGAYRSRFRTTGVGRKSASRSFTDT